jgi:hypothetical protein
MGATVINFHSNSLPTQNSSQANPTHIVLPRHGADVPTIARFADIHPHYVQIFMALWTGVMVFGIVYSSKDGIKEWWGEKRRKRELEAWRAAQRERWRGVVIVGILKGGASMRIRRVNGQKSVRFKNETEGEGFPVKVEFEPYSDEESGREIF